MRSTYEISDLFLKNRKFFKNYSPRKQKIIDSLISCRTSKLGGYIYECSNDSCGHRDQAYNSCKDRHCPKCQYRTQQQWIKARAEELLPVRYFHVVWSIPHELNELMLLNRELLSNLLFTSSSYALHNVMKEQYGIRSGAVSVLHTWGSNLSLHPHVHSIVPAGGLNVEGDKWVSTRKTFLAHVKLLGKVFRRIFIKRLKRSHREGKLFLGDGLGYLANPSSFEDFVSKLMQKEWVVYSKKSFKREIQVLKYLGRYTHRIAITNHRIKNIQNGMVTFQVKDYKNAGKPTLQTLPQTEFLRRFMMHTLPRGFMRIRHTGILGNRYKSENIKRIRQMLSPTANLASHVLREIVKITQKLELPLVCSKCSQGRMLAIGELTPKDTNEKFYNSS